MPHLNQNAAALCDQLAERKQQLGVSSTRLDNGVELFDIGVDSAGNQDAGVLLARICLADLAEVEVLSDVPWPLVAVATEHPVAACMASQYAGWEVKGDKFFAMGSGPMRAAAAREPLFDDIGYREQASHCVGVLEASQLPPAEVCADIATKCGIEPTNLTLLVARTSSLAGTLQVAARSVETTLHKLHELDFDLSRVQRGQGTAPLPPVAANDLAAIGVTNDAILYGGDVTLHVSGDDRSLEEIGPKLPSSASAEYGQPFSEVLSRYNNNFYEIDPLLFSAAMIRIENTDSGNTFKFGELNEEVLSRSFANS